MLNSCHPEAKFERWMTTSIFDGRFYFITFKLAMKRTQKGSKKPTKIVVEDDQSSSDSDIQSEVENHISGESGESEESEQSFEDDLEIEPPHSTRPLSSY